MDDLQSTIYKRTASSLFIVSCLFLISTTQALAHGGVEHDEPIIRMNDHGFEPKELTVVEGDEVLFINNDDVERWPASNFHPTHELYPEFDPQGGIPPGESWKMKFEEVGIWRMHDHLIPHMTGTIVVLENLEKSEISQNVTPNQSAKELEKSLGFWSRLKAFFARIFKKNASTTSEARLAQFRTLSEKEKYAWLEAEARQAGPESAWYYVLATYNRPEGVVGNPHDMAHLVGQLLFKEHGFQGLSTCTTDFAFGCYHGLMEVVFHENDPEEYATNLLRAQAACGELGDDNHPYYWSCIHGIGHGVVTYRAHDVKESLKDCGLLKERVRSYCYDGVFMELSISAVPSFYRRDDPLYPCNAVDGEYRSACARSQPNIMRTHFGFNTKEIALACERSGDTEIRYHCIDALGYFMGQTSGGSAIKILAGCGEISSENDHAQCLAAAAGELVFQNTQGWRDSTQEVCLALKEEGRRLCEARVEQVKQSYGRN